jgi:hypothetical protein
MAGSRTPFAFLDLRFSPSKSLIYGEHLRKGKKEAHYNHIGPTPRFDPAIPSETF